MKFVPNRTKSKFAWQWTTATNWTYGNFNICRDERSLQKGYRPPFPHIISRNFEKKVKMLRCIPNCFI